MSDLLLFLAPPISRDRFFPYPSPIAEMNMMQEYDKCKVNIIKYSVRRQESGLKPSAEAGS